MDWASTSNRFVFTATLLAVLGIHPASRSHRAHQSRRDHRSLFRPETGSRRIAGSRDPRLDPRLTFNRGHLLAPHRLRRWRCSTRINDQREGALTSNHAPSASAGSATSDDSSGASHELVCHARRFEPLPDPARTRHFLYTEIDRDLALPSIRLWSGPSPCPLF